ncbi:chromosome segregation protein SMC [Phycicoccus sp. Root101]|uniref:chromosome segregation protein SMC n=1 Tax=Phycicoccus sp. Root101 TaxID=1736421 RepID=UPI000703A530|nr:chromosome segregation protein SMC [Phycicoccus sp. Root101]KQU70606.1 chromosome segregation protein SMC [Phycicoccus sp. Root101]
MYVKSLTLKGFKSFASATTMRLEPGITCIVGPNGSGKSNVVDALAWVMGEQGAKSLRGGKMEDVIFAGTAGRAPLGRAEVALTIDNTDGALPIDYTEVTIARTMFRNGGSEYAINGTSCRLLDVQELLSDSGIGREMHVIVGQGQLDAVLRATPEERRGFIEEAAGVLKHRKRKEKALRKLESMEANLTRVNDLTGEIRRQLGPLGRQAEAARRAAGIQADARDARLRLLADDLVQLTSTLEQEVADESALIAKRTEVEEGLTTLRSRLATLEQQAQDAAPELAKAQERWFALQQLRDKLASTESLASERVRLLSQDSQDEQTTGRDPDELKAQAAEARKQEEALLADVREAANALEAAIAERTAAEQAYAAEQQRLQRLVRAAADRREGLAKLAGQVGARRSRIEAGEAEIGRLRGIVEQSQERAAAAEREFTQLEASVAVDEEGEEGLDSAYEKAAAALETLEAEVEKHKEAERTAERDRTTAAARLEALELSLSRKDGAATLLAAADSQHGIVGSVASLLQVKGGHEAAVAAALGWAGDALAVESVDHAARALLTLRADDAGRAAFLVGQTATSSDPSTWPALEGSAVWAREVVEAPATVRPAVEQLLDRVALVDDPALAAALVAGGEGVTAVTADGDVFAPGFVRGGSSHAPSLIEIQSAVDETRDRVADATRRGEQARFALTSALERHRDAAADVEVALDALHDSDAKMAAVAERLGQLGATVRAARAEAERTERSIATATEALEADRVELAALSERLDEASAEPTEAQDPSTDERDRLEALASRGRATETELRLTLRTKEERARALKGRAESLEGAARNELAARQRLAARQERRKREATVAEAVRRGAAYAVSLVATTLDTAARQRALAETARTERDQALAQVRREVSALQDELRELTDTVHRDEVARTQQRLRIEAMQAKAVEELGMDPAVLMEDFGPHQLVPHVPGPDDDQDALPEPAPYVREVQEKRLRKAERGLSALGRVNPLALEEFAALEERHKFLTDQLEDLKKSKRDLLDIVKEVDERVERVFTEAFHDTAAQFEGVFSRLFPGGEGKLTLTDPSNMLTTGIEVEARPPGKKIKRLSLLSGGERSLVAVALLVSIFKARPSPFYIMDEVEAALDDANLGRLITLFEELRDSSQLIVITHQKRTMEVADALYGVSMRGDGVTTVVSQRIRDVAAQSA